MAAKITKILFLIPLLILIGLIGFYYLFPGPTVDLLITSGRSAGGLKQQSVIVEGLHIEYLEGGKGDTLVLLHGFGADKDNWTLVGKHLTPHFRVIAPDLPGFGESSADPDLDYTIDAQVDRVYAFIRALGIETLHLGGSSMGGNIAGAYASKYPRAIKSLLLIAPAGVVSSEPSEITEHLKQGKHPLIAKSPEDFDRLLNFVFHKRPFLPGPLEKHLMQKAVARHPLYSRIFTQSFNSRNYRPLETLVKDLEVPTLIVWGANDRVLHISGAAILEAVMPKARVVVMDQVGHLPMVENPKGTADAYLTFIKSWF